MLDYRRVYITPAEEAWLKAHGRPELPGLFKTMGPDPLAEVLEVQGVRVGVVVFPDPPLFFEPGPGDVAKIVAAARSLEGQADIIVGISSWGRTREEYFFQQAEPVLDLLLGSGAGSGMHGRTEAGGKTFWVRTLAKGQYQLLIDIGKLPAQRGQAAWSKPGTINETFVELGVSYPDDPTVKALFQGK